MIGPVERCTCEKDMFQFGDQLAVSSAVYRLLSEVGTPVVPVGFGVRPIGTLFLGQFSVTECPWLPDDPWQCFKCKREEDR